MKLDKVYWGLRISFLLIASGYCANLSLKAVNSTISFTLDEPCQTSAGVYSSNGTLIRTLWSKISFGQGPQSANWNGLDDNSNPVLAGTYEIKLLQHNVSYVWDGAIGNMSAEASGPTVHRGFEFIQDMAIAGTNAFYCSGYDENQYDFRSFNTSDSQHVVSQWYWMYDQNGNLGDNPGNIYDRNWLWTATDGRLVYFACSATYNPHTLVNNSYPGCVVAYNVTDQSVAYFASGVIITNSPSGLSFALPNGVYVGSQAGLSGLSVQQSGNLMAVSVMPDNKIYLLDKTTGASISSFSVSSPGRLNFSANGTLWIVSSNNVFCYSNLTSTPSLVLTIPAFSNALDVAVSPTNANLILVADGGGSQQIRAFNSAGVPLWVYGLAGGYQVNGPAVTTNKFWFSYEGNPQTFICFAPDGTYWVGDEENHRTMHFSASCESIEQIMYQPVSYRVCVDPNNPSRVFNQFLEFSIDYTKPLSNSWTLVNNWKSNVDTNHISPFEGLYEATTFTNGRTYALIDNISYINNLQGVQSELCELTSTNLRLTGILPYFYTYYGTNGWTSIGSDGSVRSTVSGRSQWYEKTLAGFDASNNPIWGSNQLVATASAGSTDPVPRLGSMGNVRETISSNSVLISLDPSLNNGWHLGGIQLGTTNWLWRVSPSANLNGCGTYEITNVIYAGNTLQALDRNIIYGYHGEFFRGTAEASQHMHYYDDGLFVGQFGETSLGHWAYEGDVPGFAGNDFSPSLMKTTNNEYYVWENDERAHGPQRWHLVNARDIREQSGSGVLGSTITLTNPVCGFPVGLIGTNGNQAGEISWQATPGATSYNVYYSLLNGGPYNNLAGNTTNINYFVHGLNNGQAYFFTITAIGGITESIPSEQVEIDPFDTRQTALCVGSLCEGGLSSPVIDVSSTSSRTNRSGLSGLEHPSGVFSLTDVVNYGFGKLARKTIGSQGYVIYDWGGAGVSITNLDPSFTVETGSGWVDASNLNKQFNIDNVLGRTWGLAAKPVGTINIAVNDNNFHFLTVVSPAQYVSARSFTLGITSTNGTAAQYSVNEANGFSHTFQFLFKGNISLQANSTTGSGADVQAIFLDYANDNGLAVPTGLHIVSIPH